MSINPSVDAFLGALDRMTREIKGHAQAARTGIERHTFAPYHFYRDRVLEHEALVAVIRAQRDGLSADQTALIDKKLLAVERAMLAHAIRSALQFLFALSAIANLPYGVRETFMSELQSLQAARNLLRSPTHSGALPPDLEADLETAETILVEVMERAPSLISFDSAGSSEPRSGSAPA